MTEDVQSRLEQLVGETKKYQGKEIIIEKFKNVNETIVIFTDKQTYTFHSYEIELFFKDLRDPKETALPTIPNTSEISINGYQPSAENVKLKGTLMNVLDSLTGKDLPDENTLKKAKAICDIANTMVGIQKTEIQMINAIKRR